MTNTYIGILSGTSMDAIDIAAVNFDQELPEVICSISVELPTAYKTSCLQIINSGSCTVESLGQLDHWIGKLFADAILKLLDNNKSKINSNDIVAIGSHGQTIWHAPNNPQPFTMQIGDPNIIAVQTGITTVADVRRADIAAGGQGAPLAPAFHQAVFANPQEDRCILNIGGMSNISILKNNTIMGFDTGPGNCLMDNWAKQHFNLDYDRNGEIALTGKINTQLLQACLAENFFAQPAPKSTGRELFNDAWLKTKIQASKQEDLPPQDVLATLLELTAITITEAIKSYSLSIPKVFVCGGGAKNSALRARLSDLLEQNIQTTATLGIDPDWMEAALFAWVAKQTIEGIPIPLNSITGSQQPVVLGGIFGFKAKEKLKPSI